jgi:hypothetical protein
MLSDQKTIELAQKSAQEVYHSLEAMGAIGQYVPDSGWLKMGMLLWPYTYEGGKTDEQVFQQLTKADNELFQKHPWLKVLLKLPNEQIMAFWSARWVDQGCPRVVLDSKYASLLMATDVGKEMIDKVVIPWRAFLIEVPSNLLHTKGQKGELQEIQKIYVHTIKRTIGDEILNIVAITDQGLSLWRHGIKWDSLASARTKDMFHWDFGLKCDSRDDRAMNMIGRLIISMCVAMSDPDNYHEQKKSHGRGNLHRIEKELPQIKTFVLGKPIQINCRQAILDYLEGSGSRKGPTVQFLVRGHWKHQPHGPRSALRKVIHVQPYWKGDADALVLRRDYVLTDA